METRCTVFGAKSDFNFVCINFDIRFDKYFSYVRRFSPGAAAPLAPSSACDAMYIRIP
jgi:hypothetical protein